MSRDLPIVYNIVILKLKYQIFNLKSSVSKYYRKIIFIFQVFIKKLVIDEKHDLFYGRDSNIGYRKSTLQVLPMSWFYICFLVSANWMN